MKEKPPKDGTRNSSENDSQRNRDHHAVDKAPGEERGKGEKVKPENLKGKKTDADPSQESRQGP